MNEKLRASVFARDGHQCALCGSTGTSSRPLCIDHIHPQCRGGGDELTNLRVLCKSCNSAKAWSDQFAEQIPAPSGHMRQIALRMPDDLAAAVDERAPTVGLSRNAWLLKAIEWALDQPIRTITTQQKV